MESYVFAGVADHLDEVLVSLAAALEHAYHRLGTPPEADKAFSRLLAGVEGRKNGDPLPGPKLGRTLEHSLGETC